MKQLIGELESLSISAAKKVEYKETLSALAKKVFLIKKKKIAGLTEEIKAKIIEAGEKAEGTKVVFRFDFGVDGKLAKSVTQAFGKKIKDKALMLISADKTLNKFLVMTFTPKGVDVDCKAWATASTEGTGGKGGGKKDSAQFTCPDVSKIGGVMEKAKQFTF